MLQSLKKSVATGVSAVAHLRIQIRSNKRSWSNGDPPKLFEVGWGAVSPRHGGPGQGLRIRTRGHELVIFVKIGG